MTPRARAVVLAALGLVACGSSEDGAGSQGGEGGSTETPGAGGTATNPAAGLPAGNPDGTCAAPDGAGLEDSTNPRTVVGTGTKESCTGDAFVAAVAKGGVITFDCGAEAATIVLEETAKIVNDTGPIVIDGAGKITLSGGGKVRILYQNACDEAQKWISSDCNDQEEPKLTLQNLTFIDGNAKGQDGKDNRDGGGAVWVRGGRLKIVNSRFFGNVCDELGSDVGGGAVRVLDFPEGGSVARPVYVVGSTFGGADGFGNSCANGGALSSIGASWTIVNSVFTGNRAVGHGANAGQGGNGGAIYNDGNTMKLSVCGTLIEKNEANEGGSAIFFVSNDQSGSLSIEDSVFRDNPKGTFETAGYPGMFVKAKDEPSVTNSTID